MSALDYENLMPSHPNIGSQRDPNTGLQIPPDWQAGRSFLESGNHLDISSVSHYILGPDGELREYDYSEPHPVEQNEQQESIEEAQDDAGGTC